MPVAEAGARGNGAVPYSTENLAGTVAAVKTSPGRIYGIQVLNENASAAFIQIFDLATGDVVLGTSVPLLQIRVAANSYVTVPVPATGIQFEDAISIASTTAASGGTGSGSGVDVYIQWF